MILVLLGIVITVAFIVLPIVIFSLIRKRNVPVMKPLILGLATLVAGIVISCLPAIPFFYISRGTTGFMDDDATFSLITMVCMGAGTGLAMGGMLGWFLPDRRSLPEVLTYGLGICAPLVIFRGCTLVLYELAMLGVEELDMGMGALLLVVAVPSLAATLMPVAVVVLLAWFMNKKKSAAGVLIAVLAEVVFMAFSYLLEYIAWPEWLGVLELIPAALIIWFDIKHYKDFPEAVDSATRKGDRKNGKIQWPEGEDSGYDPDLIEK